VCLIERSQVSETAERTVAGRPLALPALDIHTVGAGGGSIAWRDPGGALRVGPASAGAVPGPACYGRGGQRPTVTDANLLLGRLLEDSPLAGGLMLDRGAGEALTRERLMREREVMVGQAQAALGGSAARLRVRHELRYRGQSFELVVEQSQDPDPQALRESFAEAHELRYGYRDDSAEVEL